jgi:DNA-binding winged helix-turn-helix (wHTH) protein
VFSRAQLLDGVWRQDVYIDERTVDVHVGRLRNALIRDRESDPIRTVWGSDMRSTSGRAEATKGTAAPIALKRSPAGVFHLRPR